MENLIFIMLLVNVIVAIGCCYCYVKCTRISKKLMRFAKSMDKLEKAIQTDIDKKIQETVSRYIIK